MHKKYLKKLFLFVLLCLLFIGLFNFFIDPGNVYFNKIIADQESKNFAQKLLASKYGIVEEGWNERLIKTTLASQSGNFDCIVLGSSRILQVSGIRNTGNIEKQCKKILNLGVSGASLEDLAIFSYLILNNKKRPSKVFLGIDPWTFKFQMDNRYGMYDRYYKAMNLLLKQVKTDVNSKYNFRLITNLFNAEYFYISIKTCIKNIKSKKEKKFFHQEIIFVEKPFSFSQGYKQIVMLSDGSRAYSEDFIEKHKKRPIEDISNYKIIGKAYEIEGYNYVSSIIELFQKFKIPVALVLTPYHPIVEENHDNIKKFYFEEVENIVQKLSIKYHLKIYGSYSAKVLGCEEDEFFDSMHPMNECLNRISFYE